MGKYEFPCIVLIRKLVMGAESSYGALDAYSRGASSQIIRHIKFSPAAKKGGIFSFHFLLYTLE